MPKGQSSITAVGEIALEYLDKFPDTPSRTIARTMHNDLPTIFTSVESARATIRTYRGTKGKYNRNSIRQREHFTDRPVYELPEPDTIDYSPLVIDHVTHPKTLVLSDPHIPYFDKVATEAAVNWGIEHEPDTVILNGDIIDNHHFSKFVWDPRLRNPQGEFEMLVRFLQYISAKFPKARKIWKEGNHEARFPRYLMTHAPVLWQLTALTIPDVLSSAYGYDLQLNGWEWVADKRVIKVGNLNVIHGHEIPVGGEVNIARNMFLKTYDNTLKGHSHKKNDDVIRSINNETRGSWAVGCLCDLHPQYRPINQWTHGFGFVKSQPDGSFMCANILIIDGKVL